MWLKACSSQPDYLKATSSPPLSIPTGLDKERIGQLYPIPKTAAPPPDSFSMPFPPRITVQENANIASKQVMGEQLWILNAKSPATTWSQLMNFFQQRQISITNQDLATATIETSWFTMVSQPDLITRYRLRLEQGLQSDTTEVYLANETRPQDAITASEATWPEQIQDRAHANWLADQLITLFNDPQATVGDSYLATTIDLPEKVMLSSVEREPILSVKAKAERLARAFDHALNRDGFVTFSSSADNKVYHFNQGNAKSKRSSGGKHTLEEIMARLPNTPEVNQLFPNPELRQTDVKLSGVKGYLLVQREHQGKRLIYVRDINGRRLKTRQARDLLDSIRLRLI